MYIPAKGATRGGGLCPPILKSRGTSYVLAPPHFCHNIYFDWLVPPKYKIVPASLIHATNYLLTYDNNKIRCGPRLQDAPMREGRSNTIESLTHLRLRGETNNKGI